MQYGASRFFGTTWWSLLPNPVFEVLSADFRTFTIHSPSVDTLPVWVWKLADGFNYEVIQDNSILWNHDTILSISRTSGEEGNNSLRWHSWYFSWCILFIGPAYLESTCPFHFGWDICDMRWNILYLGWCIWSFGHKNMTICICILWINLAQSSLFAFFVEIFLLW